jgi:hypothetical protein
MAKNSRTHSDNLRFDALERALRASADATRPRFSPELQERILAAVDDSEILPGPTWMVRWRRPLALAASLLAIASASILAGHWMTGEYRLTKPNLAGSDAAPSAATSVAAVAGHDSEWMQRALAAADHWGWLDEDSRTAAAWFVADLPDETDASDAAPAEDVDEAPANS